MKIVEYSWQDRERAKEDRDSRFQRMHDRWGQLQVPPPVSVIQWEAKNYYKSDAYGVIRSGFVCLCKTANQCESTKHPQNLWYWREAAENSALCRSVSVIPIRHTEVSAVVGGRLLHPLHLLFQDPTQWSKYFVELTSVSLMSGIYELLRTPKWILEEADKKCLMLYMSSEYQPAREWGMRMSSWLTQEKHDLPRFPQCLPPAFHD